MLIAVFVSTPLRGTAPEMRQIRLIAVDTHQIFQRASDATLRMRLPFGQVDEEVRVQKALRDKVSMRALRMVAARNGAAVVVDRKTAGVLGDGFQMAFPGQLNFAISARIAMFTRALHEEVVLILFECLLAQVAERDFAGGSRELLDDTIQAALRTHQGPVGVLQRTIGDEDRFGSRE